MPGTTKAESTPDRQGSPADPVNAGGILWDLIRNSGPQAKPENFQQLLFAFLERTVDATAIAIWFVSPNEWKQQLGHRIDELKASYDINESAWKTHVQNLQKSFDQMRPICVAPQVGNPTLNVDEVVNPTELMLIGVPLMLDQENRAFLEVFAPVSQSPQERLTSVNRVQQTSAFVVNYLNLARLQSASVKFEILNSVQVLAQNLHTSLDINRIAYRFVNELRPLLDVDRVSLLVSSNSSPLKVVAVSNQEQLNPRANLIAALKNIGQHVLSEGKAIKIEETGSLAGDQELQAILDEYPDGQLPQSLLAVPLHSDPESKQNLPTNASELQVVLITETFERPANLIIQQVQIGAVASHAFSALSNASELQQVPLLNVLKRVRSSGFWGFARSISKLSAILLIITAIIAGLCFYQRPLRVYGTGELLASRQQDIYAPYSGNVTSVEVKHADVVKQGDIVAKLENTDLNLDWRNLLANIAQTQKLLSTVEEQQYTSSLTEVERYQISGQLAELKIKLASLQEQKKLIKSIIDSLTIKAPIDGKISSWEPEKTILNRYVPIGSVLLEVIDPESEWVIEVNVPEDVVGYIIEQQQKLKDNEKLKVSYVLAAEPDKRFYGFVKEISERTEVSEDTHVCRVVVELSSEARPILRHGSEVSARFECGSYSAGFVWFREVAEFVNRKLLF